MHYSTKHAIDIYIDSELITNPFYNKYQQISSQQITLSDSSILIEKVVNKFSWNNFQPIYFYTNQFKLPVVITCVLIVIKQPLSHSSIMTS